MKADEIIDRYLKLRRHKDDLKKRYDAEKARVDAMLEKTENFLLGEMNKQGIQSIKTPVGTAYKQVRRSYTVGDWDTALADIRNSERWNMLERRVNKTACDEYVAEHQGLPPGVDVREEAVVNVRTS